MSTNNTAKPARPSSVKCFLPTMALGLRVLWSETAWMLQNAVRRFEISQMRRRLNEEYAALGRAANGEGDDDAMRLAASHIAFLKEEIVFLETERETKRAELVARRTRSLGLRPH